MNARTVLQELVETIDVTGGIEPNEDGTPAPVGDPEWVDLAEVYRKAKEVLAVGLTDDAVVVFTDSGTYAPVGVARLLEVDDHEGFAELSDEERNTMALLHGQSVLVGSNG